MDEHDDGSSATERPGPSPWRSPGPPRRAEEAAPATTVDKAPGSGSSVGRVIGVSALTSVVVTAMVATVFLVPAMRALERVDEPAPDAPPSDAETEGPAQDPDPDVAADLSELDPDASPVEVVTEAVLPSVARVDVPGGAGSAVVYRADGYFLTNHHVVAGAQDIRVVLADGRRLPADVVGSADFADLALLRVDADNLPTVPFADDAPAVGSLAVAIGSPFGFDATVTQGVVSAVNRSILVQQGEPLGDLVQTDAAINPGNSGGPLVNGQGQVIGINTAIVSEVRANAGIGFAIPSHNAVAVAERLLRDGEVAPAFLGIVGDTLDPQDAETFDIGVAQGARIVEVVADTPAAEAGLRDGDVIVAVDGRGIDSMVALSARIRIIEPGTNIRLDYVRDGEQLSTQIELVEIPDDPGQ
jgi:putative serine protease PepD